MRIVDGRIYHGMSLEDFTFGHAGKGGLVTTMARRQAVQIPPTGDVADEAPPVDAWVYRTWWVASCPDCATPDGSPRCTMFVWRERPLFMCAYCWNVAVGGKWRRVRFPEEAEEIERVLGARRFAHEHNYVVGETVAELKRQNRVLGVPEVVGSLVVPPSPEDLLLERGG